MKDIIYPTIKKQFDKLTPFAGSFSPIFSFKDDKGKTHLIYNKKSNMIIVPIEFFYLNYFGIGKRKFGVKIESSDEDIAKIFIELVKQSLWTEYETPCTSKPEDVFFLRGSEFYND